MLRLKNYLPLSDPYGEPKDANAERRHPLLHGKATACKSGVRSNDCLLFAPPGKGNLLRTAVTVFGIRHPATNREETNGEVQRRAAGLAYG
jgi:hypothetical protein